jgi:GH15 family glucan-1,4-alpha-glucosidase
VPGDPIARELSAEHMPYEPIESYGIIGNLETVALVGQHGSIDFFCAPLFDSPSIFAALLDDARGGRFQLAPLLDGATRRQLYLPDTNVLLTRFLSDDGVAEVSDFMPVLEAGSPAAIVRRAKTVRGEVHFRMVCEPRLDYARARHEVRIDDGGAVFISDGPVGMALRLHTRVPLRIEDAAVVAEISLRADESASFVLEELRPGEDPRCGHPDFVSESFQSTVNFWRRWLARSAYRGRWREAVNRSALTLKMLTSRRYGAIVAAPTFGLPEHVGGARNWDYRYTWIRDASFTLYGLMRLGFTEEAAAFMRWVEARAEEIGPGGTLQIMYGIDGRHALEEEELPHLEGYMRSAPVRIGNAAYRHLQLDIYGELMDSVYLFDKYGEPISYDMWNNLRRAIDWVADNWRQPDEGIWEVRGGRHEFLYSRVQCWAAVDRAIRLARKRSFPAPIARWRTARDTIYQDIFTHFWDSEKKAFVQAKNSRALDAACLLMPLIKFIGATDPRWASTLRAIESSLVSDSLVYRYRLGDACPDGLTGDEGTFSMCSFWYVECLSRIGDLARARLCFEKMLGYANHLGLYGEELGPRGQHLGNFPQAFTHLALISAAFDLDRRLSASPHHP